MYWQFDIATNEHYLIQGTWTCLFWHELGEHRDLFRELNDALDVNAPGADTPAVLIPNMTAKHHKVVAALLPEWTLTTHNYRPGYTGTVAIPPAELVAKTKEIFND